jgi:hypothetical protein
MTKNPITQIQAKSTLTDKYQFIDSSALIEKFTQADFKIVSSYAARVKNQENDGFQKHFVTFDHPKMQELRATKSLHTLSRITLINSHNGSTGLQLKMALYRLICANGMVGSIGDFAGLSLRHSKKALEQLPRAIELMLENSMRLSERVEQLSQLQTNYFQQREFSKGALELKLGENYERLEGAFKDNALDLMLHSRRSLDAGNDAWKVFNRVQENFMRKGIGFSINGKDFVNLRDVKSPNSQLEKNEKLWDLAEKTIFQGAV